MCAKKAEAPQFVYNFPRQSPDKFVWEQVENQYAVIPEDIVMRYFLGDFEQKPGLWGVVALSIMSNQPVPNNLPMFVYTEAVQILAGYGRGLRHCPCGNLTCELEIALRTIDHYISINQLA